MNDDAAASEPSAGGQGPAPATAVCPCETGRKSPVAVATRPAERRSSASASYFTRLRLGPVER